jgi:PmbA protein
MSNEQRLPGAELAAAAVEEARRQGIDLAEAYLSSSEELELEVRNREVENLKLARESGLGIRVIREHAQGYAFTSELSREAVSRTVQAALANAAVVGSDPNRSLPSAADAYPPVDQSAPDFAAVPLAEKIALAREIEAAGRSTDRRITLTEATGYQEAAYETWLASTRGLSLYKKGSFCGGYAAFVAGEGDGQQTGFGLQFSRSYRELDPQAIGREAAGKALRMLGAARVPTARVAVVFDPYVVASLLALISSALSAEAVQKGRSLFAGKLGQQVASPLVTVVDDGTLAGGLFSAPFDGEGVPCRKTVLIERGNLQGLMYNSYTAAKDGVSSTGNAGRASFQSPPELASTNFYLAPGDQSPQEIIAATADGFYLTEVMGMHMANPISGDFSLGAAGIWIRNGEFSKPVRGMVIAGNILSLLEQIDAVGSDLRFFTGRGAPTIRAAELTVSGE